MVAAYQCQFLKKVQHVLSFSRCWHSCGRASRKHCFLLRSWKLFPMFWHKLQQTLLDILIFGVEVVVLLNKSNPFISSIICSPYILTISKQLLKLSTFVHCSGSFCRKQSSHFQELQIKRYVSLTQINIKIISHDLVPVCSKYLKEVYWPRRRSKTICKSTSHIRVSCLHAKWSKGQWSFC